jgi:spermidine/putrescine transport system ATP-binding protein
VRLPDGTVLRAPADGTAPSGPVRVGVRPEKLKVDSGDQAGATDGLNALSGTVLDASYMGVSTQYLVQTSEGHRLTVYAQNLNTAGAGELLADGQHVQLTWQPQHTFVIGGQAEHVAGDQHIPEQEGATVE